MISTSTRRKLIDVIGSEKVLECPTLGLPFGKSGGWYYGEVNYGYVIGYNYSRRARRDAVEGSGHGQRRVNLAAEGHRQRHAAGGDRAERVVHPREYDLLAARPQPSCPADGRCAQPRTGRHSVSADRCGRWECGPARRFGPMEGHQPDEDLRRLERVGTHRLLHGLIVAGGRAPGHGGGRRQASGPAPTARVRALVTVRDATCGECLCPDFAADMVERRLSIVCRY